MYDEELEFDSDEFGIQKIDWDDIQRLRSKSKISLNVEDQDEVTGKLQIDGKTVTLLHDDDTNSSFQSNQIVSLNKGYDDELSFWSGKIAAGYTQSSGNTDKVDANVQVNIKRQTASTRFITDYLGNYGESDNNATENNHRLSAKHDVFITRHLFWRSVFAEFFRDPFQNIAQKYTYGTGIGYDIIASGDATWTIFGGPAYQTTNYVSVLDSNDTSIETGALVLSTNFDYDITSDVEFIIKYQCYFVNEQSGTYVHHFLTALETEIINDFEVDLTFIWDRIEDPVRNDDGTLPLQDDYKSIVSIGWSF